MRMTSGLYAWMLMQSKPDRVPEPPAEAIVETGALCGLRCPLCSTGNGTFGLSRSFLSRELFSRILDRLGGSLRRLSLFNRGEPLLHPELHGLIREAAGRGIDVMVHTSLSVDPFGPREADLLTRSGLSRLVVSCDGISQKAYETYRVGGRVDWALRNLRELLEAKARSGAQGLRIWWKFLVHRGNQHEILPAAELARRLGVPIHFGRLQYPEEQAGRWDVEAPSLPAGFTPELAPDLVADDADTCLQVWDKPVIHSDGTVMPCCVLAEPKWALGSLATQDFKAVWNGPRAVAMRRYLRTGQRQDLELPCYTCTLSPHGRSVQSWLNV